MSFLLLFQVLFSRQTSGFYRGLSWPLMSFGAVNSVFFGVYGNTLKYLEKDKDNRKSSHINIYLAGCTGGMAQLVLVIPTDHVKVVLQSQIPHDGRRPTGNGYNYSKVCSLNKITFRLRVVIIDNWHTCIYVTISPWLWTRHCPT